MLVSSLMVFSRRAFRGIGVGSWAVAGLLAGAVAGRAEGLSLESLGVRGGSSADFNRQEFTQVDGFVNMNLPWGWDVGKEWHVQSRLDLSLGWLGARGNDAIIGGAGPSFVLSRARLPLSFEAGVSPTGMSRSAFGTEDLGAECQFTLHIGLNWDFARHWRVGYRYQHMSNANLGHPNPGLNMHMLALSYVF